MDEAAAQVLLDAIVCREPVSGLTHDFYRYPARFSPLFVRAMIEAFSDPGDVVLDPFLGGGTTLVEARALGRIGVGFDLNALSGFLVRAKTMVITDEDARALRSWGERLVERLNTRRPSRRATNWIDDGYQRNLSGKNTWPTRKLLEQGLETLSEVGNSRQERLARVTLLKTAQWALDCRTQVPSAGEFRRQLLVHLDEVVRGALAFGIAARRADRGYQTGRKPRTLFFQRSVEGIENDPCVSGYLPPRLIVTSPPYPGVHVLYHRWQIQGRRETPAPFWIANEMDGNGASYYTFGDRKRPGLEQYFLTAERVFSSLRRIAGPQTTVVQMVAFSDPTWQLPAYLNVMSTAGFREVQYPGLATAPDGRAWRVVPGRKWYARSRGTIPASKEVVLIHEPKA